METDSRIMSVFDMGSGLKNDAEVSGNGFSVFGASGCVFMAEA